jgi:hypothetical protein
MVFRKEIFVITLITVQKENGGFDKAEMILLRKVCMIIEFACPQT